MRRCSDDELLWLVHTADTDEAKLSSLVRVGGVNKLQTISGDAVNALRN